MASTVAGSRSVHTVQLDRDGYTPGERGEGGVESFVGEQGRVDATGEGAQFVERADHFGVGFGEEPVERGASVGEAAADELKGEADPEQALLGAVVEVALEPSALGVAGFDDARSRGPHLVELGAQLGLQAGVLQRQARRRADRVDEGGVVEECGVVNERGEAPAVALQDGDGAARLGVGVELCSVRPDVALTVREPEGEHERLVAQGAGDRVADLGWREWAVEGDDEIGDRGPVQPGAQQTDEEGDGDRAERDAGQPFQNDRGGLRSGCVRRWWRR